jgi:signal transduction histidine kinase/CheY-like chemotaxis protein
MRVNDGVSDLLRRTVPFTRPDPRIAIVDVDERSLQALGQWPWRRDRLGALVDRLQAMGARAVAFDVLFSEPEREASFSDGDVDAAFAATLRRARVVLGHALTFGRTAGRDGCVLQPMPITVVEPDSGTEAGPLFEATGAVCSLPSLTSAAGASGFLNAAPDSDGVLRRVPLAIEMRGRVYPSLGLAASLALLDGAVGELRVLNANATALTIGGRTVPLDGRGNLLLRFRGRQRTFPFVSAADVIARRAPPDAFRDKLVFVGATALGTQELVTTPHDARFIGVEVQATVADNLLQGDFFHRPAEAPLIEGGLALAAAGGLAFAAARFGLLGGGVAAAAALATLWGGAWWLLGGWGVLLSPVLPSVSVACAGVGVALAATARAARDASAQLRRARADADAATQAHPDFLATVSRELRTPLAAIQGYARMISRGALADDGKVQALAAVERHAVAQTRVIDDLFEASRAAAGRIRLARQHVELSGVVLAAAEAVTPAREARRIALSIVADPELPPVVGDPERLRQVVWHLMSNAVKFTPAGGRIDVLLTRAGDAVELVVRDTGAGLAGAELPDLFVAQTRGGTLPAGRGLGLGLPLVRQIVELHGGTVSAESEGPGRGATLRVRLPLDSAVQAVTSGQPLPHLEGVRVVVEDERAAERGRLASALLQAGASVVTAASSQEALTLMRDDSRDVLVVAISGGDRDGYWLAREALAVALNRGERLAIVAVGNADHADERALLAGVAIDRYLRAPVDIAQLVSAVADITRNSNHHAH